MFRHHLFESQLIHPKFSAFLPSFIQGLYAAASIGGLNAPGLYFIVRSLSSAGYRNSNRSCWDDYTPEDQDAIFLFMEILVQIIGTFLFMG